MEQAGHEEWLGPMGLGIAKVKQISLGPREVHFPAYALLPRAQPATLEMNWGGDAFSSSFSGGLGRGKETTGSSVQTTFPPHVAAASALLGGSAAPGLSLRLHREGPINTITTVTIPVVKGPLLFFST